MFRFQLGKQARCTWCCLCVSEEQWPEGPQGLSAWWLGHQGRTGGTWGNNISCDAYSNHNRRRIKIKHPPVELNVVPGPVETIKRFLSLTNVWCLADIDTCGNMHVSCMSTSKCSFMIQNWFTYTEAAACPLKNWIYHRNGHVAVAGTCPSRIWTGQFLCSSVPTLSHRLNAKSQGPWTDDKIKLEY